MECPDSDDIFGKTSPNPLYYMLRKELDENRPFLNISTKGELKLYGCHQYGSDAEVVCSFKGKLEFVEKLGGQNITMNNEGK
jgi:hypothetical protein